MRKQFGRSMIEMLGVLAIIAVLSIGGIVLYRRAVNNHQANSILDDANRLAFAVIESNRSFRINYDIDGLDVTQTSSYEIVPFMGATAGQFGIVAEDVPKGVCEALIEKASVEYKVRVLPAGAAKFIDQIANTGTVYDTLHKDVCTNDINDVVLFFGDTSAQCNAPEGDGPCTENSDCCAGFFCAYVNATGEDKIGKGNGQCQAISVSNGALLSGQRWITSSATMNWYSAYNYCEALGMKMTNRTELNCSGIEETSTCKDSSVISGLKQKWGNRGYHWLNDEVQSGYAVSVDITNAGRKAITVFSRVALDYALCH